MKHSVMQRKQCKPTGFSAIMKFYHHIFMFTWDISFEAEYVLLSESIERVTQWGRTRYWIFSTSLVGHIRWTQNWLACRLFMHHPLFNSAAREKSSVGRVLWFFASEWRENCLFIKFEERWKNCLNFCVCRQASASITSRASLCAWRSSYIISIMWSSRNKFDFQDFFDIFIICLNEP